MRLPRWTPVAVAAALALTAGGVAAAAAGHDRPEAGHGTAGSTVVNVNGHPVDEHAAFGQSTAAQARAQGEDADTDDDADVDTDADESDREDGKAGQEHGKAGQEHGKAGQEHGHGWAFGHLSPESRHQAIADMQAAHHDARPEHGQQQGRDDR
ncbi:hypothetical protein [Nocardioides taihuensis]|uniref:Uncharacterized protein n=1 Tax=Nocardioides taihuensis TaxID=1835606 RepID=A0ABW0BR23_9ACTN